MTLLLYVWSGPPAEAPYSPAALAALAREHPAATALTMDAASDTLYRQRVLGLLQEADVIQAVVECPATPSEDTRGLRPVLEALIRHWDKLQVQVIGEHPQLAPMLRVLKRPA